MSKTQARTAETTQTRTLPAILTARSILCKKNAQVMVLLPFGCLRTWRKWQETQYMVQVFLGFLQFSTMQKSYIALIKRIKIVLTLQTPAMSSHVSAYTMEISSSTTVPSPVKPSTSTQSSSQASRRRTGQIGLQSRLSYLRMCLWQGQILWSQAWATFYQGWAARWVCGSVSGSFRLCSLVVPLPRPCFPT